MLRIMIAMSLKACIIASKVGNRQRRRQLYLMSYTYCEVVEYRKEPITRLLSITNAIFTIYEQEN